MTLLSITEWGQSHGISRQAAHKAIKRCNIPVNAGKVDAEVASMLYRQRTKARAKPNTAPALNRNVPPEPDAAEVPPGYQESRARREAAEAELAEIRAAEARGDMVSTDRVRREVSTQASHVREALLSLPARLAPLLAMSPIGDVQRVLDAEIRAALHALADGAVPTR